MIERSSRAGFLLETPKPVGVAGEDGRDNLDCHVTPEPGIVGAVDLPHAACANLRHDFVSADARASGEGHAWDAVTVGVEGRKRQGVGRMDEARRPSREAALFLIRLVASR